MPLDESGGPDLTKGRSDGNSADGEKPEHTRDFTGNTGVSEKSCAESGAMGAENGPVDPDLAAVVAVWPTLPEPTRRKIVAMVQEAAENCGIRGGGEQ